MISDDAARLESLPPAARALFAGTDWSALRHVCTGMHGVPDTPDILLGLLDNDPARRVRAVHNLDNLVLHQETVHAATAPAARYVAAVLGDPRTCTEALWEGRPGRRPLRAELLNWLGRFADTVSCPSYEGPGASGHVAASQAVRLALHADIAVFLDDADPSVREAALAAAALLLAAPELVHHIPATAPAVRRILAVSANSRYRWIARRCLQAWGQDIDDLTAKEEVLCRAEREAATVAEDPWADPQASADAHLWLAERPEDTAEPTWLARRRTGELQPVQRPEPVPQPGPADLVERLEPEPVTEQGPTAGSRAVVISEGRAHWTFTPFVGVGPVHFGMSPQDVEQALGDEAPNSRWQHSPGSGPRLREAHFPALGVSTYYEGTEPGLACVAVDARTGPQVVLEARRWSGVCPPNSNGGCSTAGCKRAAWSTPTRETRDRGSWDSCCARSGPKTSPSPGRCSCLITGWSPPGTTSRAPSGPPFEARGPVDTGFCLPVPTCRTGIRRPLPTGWWP
ncbi:hypothetical protein ACFV0O_41055 [Kitasatospora sp. NPDC059577]|uniref:hypothetical protein n=1 Tax=Kitasatospora sp. NPDC059577 TaxID=3346873 RepID=UPI003680F0CC